MAPTTTETATYTQAPKAFRAFNGVEAVPSKPGPFIPLKLSGSLESFKQFDLTTVIGTQFENINLTEILHSSDCDVILRDLAITSKHYLRTHLSRVSFLSAVVPMTLKLIIHIDETYINLIRIPATDS